YARACSGDGGTPRLGADGARGRDGGPAGGPRFPRRRRRATRRRTEPGAASVPRVAQARQDPLDEPLESGRRGKVHEAHLEVVDAGAPEPDELASDVIGCAGNDVELRPPDGVAGVVRDADPGHLRANDGGRVAADVLA